MTPRYAEETAETTVTEEAPAENTNAQPAATEPRPRRNGNPSRIISIDGTLQAETESKQKQADLLDFSASLRSKTRMTGVVTGIEFLSTGNGRTSIAVIQRGVFKVMIAFNDFLRVDASQYAQAQAQFSDRSQFESYLLTKRLNSEVDYIVRAVDPQNELVVASRVDAMDRLKRVNYINNVRGTSHPLIQKDKLVEARICATFRTGIIVEVGGVETLIKSTELSYQRIQDATREFSVGDKIVVKILDVHIEDGDVQIEASVKDAYPDPRVKAIQKISEQCRYIGTVTHISTSGIFVSLPVGIDVLCAFPERERPVRGATVSVRITKINEEALRVFGVIVHIV